MVARDLQINEGTLGNWALAPPLPPGRHGLAAGSGKPTSREQQLEAEVADLTTALGEAAVELRVWKKSAEGRLGPSKTSR